MLPLLALSSVALLLTYVVANNVISFRRNLRAAQKSGIHYISVPVFFLGRFWLTTHLAWCKYVFARFPDKLTRWVDFTMPEVTYDYQYEIFARVGHDTFLTVSPGGNALFTCEPEVVTQITTRRNDFPKPTHIYRAINIYGTNVVSSEGHAWRRHRKATSPPFTEKNNHLVWTETITHTTAMLQSWLGGNNTSRTIDRVMDDTMRLSLYVISGAGFGRKVQWPKDDNNASDKATKPEDSKIQNDQDDTDPGHTMSWTYALHTLLDTILFQFLLPRWVLDKVPLKPLQMANHAYAEWGKYMKEAADNRREEIKAETTSDAEMDILRQLVKTQMEAKSGPSLSEQEILANMFVIILAGHETAANSIHFAILYLALQRDSQQRLQKDLEQIFGGRSPQQWKYDEDLPHLFSGMAGAVLAEELRLVPPVVNIPKSTMGLDEQPLTVEGKECIVPANTFINLCTTAAQRHPKHWPFHKPRLPGGRTAHPVSNIDNDLEEFRPERWLTRKDDERHSGSSVRDALPAEALSGDSLGVNLSSDISDHFYRPVKGSYFPFSEGYRACLGRRFAQVEVLAAIAVLYQNHSIELAVDKYATDEELDKMDINQRAEVWHKAAEDARNLFVTGMGAIISLQMRAGTVPVRVVPKGQERFPADIDEIWKHNNPDRCSPLGKPGWRSWKGDSIANRHHSKLA